MKISTLSKECELIDIETKKIVGVCELRDNGAGKMIIRVTPFFQGVKYPSILFDIYTERPLAYYQNAMLLEIYGIHSKINDTINHLKKYTDDKEMGINKIIVSMQEPRIIRKKGTNLKDKLNEYFDLRKKMRKMLFDFDLNKYKKSFDRLNELKQELIDADILDENGNVK